MKLILAIMALVGSLLTCGIAFSATNAPGGQTAIATFAGGCFWCMEPPFDELDGVISTVSGYMGGHIKDPTYKEVSGGQSGHAEVVQITYDPLKITYTQLLQVFWKNIDPFAENKQFCDTGSQYRSGVFFHTPQEQLLAEQSRDKIIRDYGFKQPIATEIVLASQFYPAEEYHQNYYIKKPWRYKFYRSRCGRDQRLAEVWGER